MDLLFTIIELTAISVGAGSAFIFDSFFILSAKKQRIRPYEEKVLRRLSLYSVVAAAIAICSYCVVLAFEFTVATDLRISISFSKLIILAGALLCGMTLRAIHLKALLRHQQQYGHLSEHMFEHPNPIVSTAVYSSVSWMIIIFLTALENRGIESDFHFGLVTILLTYILLGYIGSHIGIFLKTKVSNRR